MSLNPTLSRRLNWQNADASSSNATVRSLARIVAGATVVTCVHSRSGLADRSKLRCAHLRSQIVSPDSDNRSSENASLRNRLEALQSFISQNGMAVPGPEQATDTTDMSRITPQSEHDGESRMRNQAPSGDLSIGRLPAASATHGILRQPGPPSQGAPPPRPARMLTTANTRPQRSVSSASLAPFGMASQQQATDIMPKRVFGTGDTNSDMLPPNNPVPWTSDTRSEDATNLFGDSRSPPGVRFAYDLPSTSTHAESPPSTRDIGSVTGSSENQQSAGTLVLGRRGRSKYLGPTAASEWLKDVKRSQDLCVC